MLPRGWTPVQRLPRRFDRASLVRPIPFGLCRFRPDPAGFLSPTSLASVTRQARLSAGCPPPRSFRPSTAPTRPWPVLLSWGSDPLQRSTEAGTRVRPRPCGPTIPGGLPSSGTFRPQGFAPSRRFPAPATMGSFIASARLSTVRCIRPALLGFPRTTLRHSPRPFGRGRATAPAFPLQGSPSSRDEHAFLVLSSLALRPGSLSGRPPFDGPGHRLSTSTGLAGASESRSQEVRHFPEERPPNAGLPEVPG